MANNLRTFYACQAVAVEPLIPDSSGLYGSGIGTAGYQFIHGVQSVGLNSSFDFENIFELGQLEIYDSVLNIPEIEITIEKVLDGYMTVYGILSSGQGVETASKRRANVRFALYGDEGNANASVSGFPSGNLLGTIQCTGMYINSVTYTFPVDGNCTESVTLVGNHKQWYPQNGSGTYAISIPANISNGATWPDDRPPFASGVGGVGRLIRRQDVAISSPVSTKAQNVTLTLNLAREDVFEFGQRIPYAKLATYPIEATAEVECLAVSGSYDTVSFDENTVSIPNEGATSNIVVTAGPYIISVGGVFLTAISHTGGDATGGNATVSRSYTAYNSFIVTDTGVK